MLDFSTLVHEGVCCDICGMSPLRGIRYRWVFESHVACIKLFYVCVHVHEHVCMYACMYVCTYVRMYIRMYVPVYVRMYAYVNAYERVNLCNAGSNIYISYIHIIYVTAHSQSSLPENDIRIRSTSLAFISGGNVCV